MLFYQFNLAAIFAGTPIAPTQESSQTTFVTIVSVTVWTVIVKF